MNKFDLVVVGELNVDLIFSGLNSFPSLGKEILANNFEITLGSSSAIFACGISNLGTKVGFIGKLGKDTYGEIVLDWLKRYQVDTSGIIIDPKIQTGITLSLSYPQDRALITYLGSISSLVLKNVDFGYLENARHLHLSSYFLQSGIRKDCVKLFEQAKKKGLTISFDTGYDPQDKWDDDVRETLRFVDIFLPNEMEAKKISGQDDIENSLEYLSKLAKNVVIKLGSQGAIGIDEKGNKIYEKAFPVEVVDTTGAGDSFNAGFIYGFLNKKSFGECLKLANACGAISVTKIGGAASCPTIKELNEFMKEKVNAY